MENKTDRRALQSRHAIEKAFLFLLETQGFDSLTVKKIAETAHIGRKTFYLHYQDLYDLLQQVLDKEMAGLAGACGQREGHTYAEGASAWFHYFAQRKKFFLPLFASWKTALFRDRLLALLMEDLRKKARQRGEVLHKIDCWFFSMALMGTVESFLMGKLQTGLEETARRVGELLEKNLQHHD